MMFFCDYTLLIRLTCTITLSHRLEKRKLLPSSNFFPTAFMIRIVNLSKKIFQQSTRVGILFRKVTTMASSVVGQVGMSRKDSKW